VYSAIYGLCCECRKKYLIGTQLTNETACRSNIVGHTNLANIQRYNYIIFITFAVGWLVGWLVRLFVVISHKVYNSNFREI